MDFQFNEHVLMRESKGHTNRGEGPVKISVKTEAKIGVQGKNHQIIRGLKRQGRILFLSLLRECDSIGTLVLDFRPLKLGENKCLLFSVNKFLISCPGISRKLRQCPD